MACKSSDVKYTIPSPSQHFPQEVQRKLKLCFSVSAIGFALFDPLTEFSTVAHFSLICGVSILNTSEVNATYYLRYVS